MSITLSYSRYFFGDFDTPEINIEGARVVKEKGQWTVAYLDEEPGIPRLIEDCGDHWKLWLLTKVNGAVRRAENSVPVRKNK